MTRKLILYALLAYSLPLHSQVVTVSDLVSITSLTDKKLSTYMNKMNFVQTGRSMDNGAMINEFFYNNKKNPTDTIMRFVSGYNKGKTSGAIFQTSSYEEYQSILRQFRNIGFLSGRVAEDSILRYDSTRIDNATFLQKQDMTVRTKEEIKDEIKVYEVILEKRPVPTASSIRFADDLLLFDSHEHLVALFGQSNVRRDMYHFSDTDSSRCSVLFPNSPRQAIFIWEDQALDRTIAFLLIGGSLRAEGSSDFNQSVALNNWRSYSGLYTGMRLSEIIRVNESDFNFFGSKSEFAFMAVPEKKGNIDFKKTGITLGCFNCNSSPVIDKEKISAEAALDAGLQLYVLSMVFLPEK